MASPTEFLTHLWNCTIDRYMQEEWIDYQISQSERRPDAPFADLGPVLKRLLALGATRRELSLIARFAAYSATFETIHALDDPGIDERDDIAEIGVLHESLLMADPSGMEGRPGSAP